MLLPGITTRMLSSGANELLIRVSTSQQLTKVGNGMGEADGDDGGTRRPGAGAAGQQVFA
jgi:hypothetical protein